jgi:competence ComEA-like helix-hairpin-helix protein
MNVDHNVLERISKEAGVASKQAEATVGLLENQGTVPFIARYRKELTGNLNEVQIRTISERFDYYRQLLERRETILKSIQEQGKLSDDLRNRIEGCYEKAELEDLYLPFKPKRKTKASVAIEKGLEPLARFLYEQIPGDRSIEELSESFVNAEKSVSSRDEALEGALHIVAEWISEDVEIRRNIRELFLQEGMVVSKVNKDKAGQKTKYDMYYDFREPVAKIPSHRMLAIRRGVKEQVLSFTIDVDAVKALRLISGRVIKDAQSLFAAKLEPAVKDSYERLLNPSLQSEVRTLLKERSDAEAIKVFEANLSNLLLAPPAGLIGVMGIDPGFRTGCKVAVVNETGKFLQHVTIYPTEPRKDIAGSEWKLYRLIQKHNVRAIAIGNGTGSRETDAFVRDFIRRYQSGQAFEVVKADEEKTQSDSTSAAEVQQDVLQEHPVAVVGDALVEGTVRENSAEYAAGRGDVTPVAESALTLETMESPATIPLPLEGLGVPEAASAARLPEAAVAVATETVTDGEETDISSTASVVAAETERSTVAPAEVTKEAAALTLAAEPASEAESAKAEPDVTDERHSIFSVIVNESGASVYSASDSARREFPKLDVTVRGAVSIARRLQDPLAELVKIHPKSVGVGQYQHDVDQKRLKGGLETTVESCVNQVGVDLNTASYELLRYCSGVNQRLAKSIVEYRNQHGRFANRAQLLQVPGFGDKTFEQAAGFLRIKGGDNPLDSTAVHPESYALVEQMAQSVDMTIAGLIENHQIVAELQLERFADEKAGVFTLTDIQQELLKPGRDPRAQFVVPVFRDDVKEVADLKVDMVLEGTVTNVTNFGAFVDIGVHQDGLVHVSELSNRFIQDPREAVHVGEVVKVKVIGVDVAMKRISLSIKALLPERKKSRSERRKESRRQKKPMKAVAAAGREAKPNSAASNDSAEPGEKRKSKPHRPARAARVESKREPQINVKAEPKPKPKPNVAKKPEPPSTALLSFEEKIRLLQQKFGGIR